MIPSAHEVYWFYCDERNHMWTLGQLSGWETIGTAGSDPDIELETVRVGARRTLCRAPFAQCNYGLSFRRRLMSRPASI
jgi:hypothetical protein